MMAELSSYDSGALWVRRPSPRVWAPSVADVDSHDLWKRESGENKASADLDNHPVRGAKWAAGVG